MSHDCLRDLVEVLSFFVQRLLLMISSSEFEELIGGEGEFLVRL